ncbi:MAG: nitrogen fixation protein NifZ [Candidatus Thiodiazotropha endolucinida]|uniref:Nitrogen fixation protein NifZ n=2 Tax=Candidatus Thiodiazotropha TaxID=1913444 RepID=A0A7Z0VLL7_9GAMM|nr:nitrogen fixation protein NifZ [Candidatus Thiodiazotropha endolucinida]MCG7876239.1 nitrogen fixation protein NifZ [Candidatus Thiodiazotropha taylori]MCG7882213.1 nitrogen fixation protein NifZ [Candidatus Thiodiazotropha taylori]MCG7885718.1 nitrogen fixation protein NifZ [Candidatus Thiodiazotropha taylori]MCG7892685.1 nitrogen fixation protein NifZ [Candidatus Thiodiazotropha taylori]MCG7951397.1 nitrogen fixation protein NifZ [Candidatus Thiodiazotropha taylori]
MLPKFEYGEAVRVIRNLRNDGTYPGKPTGRLLIRRGSVGYVRDVGTFLQDQLIYSVDFIDDGIMVGCREQELQLETDPWIPTRFEFRDKVTPKLPLSIRGDVIARSGDEGEIEKVLRDHPGGPAYHARFNGRILLVLEPVLEFLHAVDEET